METESEQKNKFLKKNVLFAYITSIVIVVAVFLIVLLTLLEKGVIMELFGLSITPNVLIDILAFLLLFVLGIGISRVLKTRRLIDK